MSTRSFLVLFLLVAVVVLSTPAIASDDQPLRHKGCKPPKTGPPTPSPELTMDEEDIDDNKYCCQPPELENEAMNLFRRKRCKKPIGPPTPSPEGEFMTEEEEEEMVENKRCKRPKPEPVPPPEEQIDHIRSTRLKNQSHQLRHRKDPPSPSPSPAEE